MTTAAARSSLEKTTSAKLLAARLPVKLAAAVRRELAPDEVVTWIGQPSPSLLPRRHRRKSVFGVAWTAFFVAYMVWLRDSGPPVLLISPFVYVGLSMTLAPWTSAAAATQSVYLVTDRRALVVGKGELGGYGWPAFRLKARSYGPGELHDLQRVDKGAGEASGVLVHFPFYFGVVAVAVDSGLVVAIAGSFAELTRALPLSPSASASVTTFFAAAIINLAVPSGGGQWAVQGPLIAETARVLVVDRVPLVMAFAYGDQLTNLLQPFWALPILSITGLQARDLLPWTARLMVVGLVVTTLGLCLLG